MKALLIALFVAQYFGAQVAPAAAKVVAPISLQADGAQGDTSG